MAGFTNAVCMLVLATVLLVAVSPRGEAAMRCGEVVSDLTPCLPYVTNQGALGGCCGGIKTLYNAAGTTPDRQSVCSCLKALAGSYSINMDKAAGLPGLCGVNVPYKISPSTDCSKSVLPPRIDLLLN